MEKQRINYFSTIIVEDEPLILNSLVRNLNVLDSGFKVIKKCVNGVEALKCLQEEVIHLVITDINMPVMDGLALAKRIREHYPNVIILIVTGYADFEYAREALKYNIFDYLLKPINLDELENALNKVRLRLETHYTLKEDSHVLGKDSKKIVEFAKFYILENYVNEVDFSALAYSLGFSSAYLTKIFTKHVGETPIKYLTNLRIQEAKRLLADTSLPIQKVGEMVGYPDQFYFSKTFRKYAGVNPSGYRKRKNAERNQEEDA